MIKDEVTLGDCRLILGDCLEVMKEIPDKSVDAVVTDPPYELGFMGKKWDGTGIAYSVEMWSEVLRVLKPGGHLLAFGGTRTYHRMACAIEDAGFEIRDQIQWLYGSGFPKSYNISKGIDKRAGAEREVIGIRKAPGMAKTNVTQGAQNRTKYEFPETSMESATPEAQQWDGWGSALKPANEPICLARKPLSEKTIVENVLKWGTAGMNIDGCRVGTEQVTVRGDGNVWVQNGRDGNPSEHITHQGRFPANLILDEEAGRMLDEQSGNNRGAAARASGATAGKMGKHGIYNGAKGEGWEDGSKSVFYSDKGGASRFFYCAKASRKERNAGLEGMEEKPKKVHIVQSDGRKNAGKNVSFPTANHHPTVKPISLMRYLCRLITPPGGVVLDPFMGSGTTGCACLLEGFDFIGIEQNEEYVEIAERRIEYQCIRVAQMQGIAKIAQERIKADDKG